MSSFIPGKSSGTLIDYKKLRLLIIDCPSNDRMDHYIEIFRDYGVTDIVQACESDYDITKMLQIGIQVHVLKYTDGGLPSEELIKDWLDLVHERFLKNGSMEFRRSDGDLGCIAVHCVAGLGRAPVLVALALIEHCGMKTLDAIEFIRSRRRGAFNSRQIQFLDEYRVKKQSFAKKILSLFKGR